MKPDRFSKGRPREARKNKHADETRDVPEMSEDELLARVEADDSALLLILDCVTDPHNLGACLRSAAAAGVLAVVAPKDKTAPLTDTARRVSCGGAEVVPYVMVTNLSRAMRRLRDVGVWITGTSDQSERSLYDMDLKGRVALALGAEGEGIRRLTAEHCDFLCRIPMNQGPVDCLNVSVAAGVCLFEAVRQRGSNKTGAIEQGRLAD